MNDFEEAEKRVITSIAQLDEVLGKDDDPTKDEQTAGPAYATIISRVILVLGGQSVPPGDLPGWCSGAEVMVAMEHHWLSVPLAIGSQPTELVPRQLLMAKMGARQQSLSELLSAAGVQPTQSLSEQ
jgi:hypothetical protein